MMFWFGLTLLACWLNCSAFLGSVRRPSELEDLEVRVVSHVDLLVLSELWACGRSTCEKPAPGFMRGGRPISVSGVPVGLGNGIWT